MTDKTTRPQQPEQSHQSEQSEQSELSYEEARDQLIEVVRTLEQGGTSLAGSLALWERGEELARTCQTALEGARARLDAVIQQD